jgi:hypothetical protein
MLRPSAATLSPADGREFIEVEAGRHHVGSRFLPMIGDSVPKVGHRQPVGLTVQVATDVITMKSTKPPAEQLPLNCPWCGQTLRFVGTAEDAEAPSWSLLWSKHLTR